MVICCECQLFFSRENKRLTRYCLGHCFIFLPKNLQFLSFSLIFILILLLLLLSLLLLLLLLLLSLSLLLLFFREKEISKIFITKPQLKSYFLLLLVFLLILLLFQGNI